LTQELHLELSEEKTRITHINDGIDFLGFHIQRVKPEGRWVVHLRPTAKSTQRVKKKIKDLTSGNWTWLDEYIRLSSLNAIVRGWAEYYKYTSLLEDIEEITRYTWFRYLQWLMRKHKGARKQALIAQKTKDIHHRTRWRATIQEGGTTLETYQWLPTRHELQRKRYPHKGKGGFPHSYLDEGASITADDPMGEQGPAERIYTDTRGATSRDTEPLDMAERKLRVKIRDHFRCRTWGRMGNAAGLHVHHTKGMASHRMRDLITLCRDCHHQQHASNTPPHGKPDAYNYARPVWGEG
jgi:RNA-directed DNA polymerase